MSLGIFRAFVLDEIAEIRFLALADRRLKRDRLLRHFQHRAHAIDREKDFFRHFFRRWLAPVFLEQAASAPA